MADDRDVTGAVVTLVDLTDCDQEPIHLLGGIQPIGCLIAIDALGLVTDVSANVSDFLGRASEHLLGQPVWPLLAPDAAKVIHEHMARASNMTGVGRLFRVQLRLDGPRFDIAMHRLGTKVVLECEPSDLLPETQPVMNVVAMLERLRHVEPFADMAAEAASQMRQLIGFDRVMIYQFHPDGSGEVVAEAALEGLEPLQGLRYPASDIPAQARALYVRNWLRQITDARGLPIPVLPHPAAGEVPLDLSMSTLRAVSPVHLEYLRNMGVAASLSVSLLIKGKLWGLIACHHLQPRHISFERRTAAELFGQLFSLLLENRMREDDAAYDAHARRLHNELLISFAADASIEENMELLCSRMSEAVACDGMAVWLDGAATLSGATPAHAELVSLVKFLDREAGSQVYTTSQLHVAYPASAAFGHSTAGLLAIPISRKPRDYLMFFRGEVAQTVDWAGDPAKSVTPSAETGRLSPRTSFAAWRQEVRGQSAPWTAGELRSAESLRVTLLEVILRLTDAADKERRAFAERQELLIAELNHRVRNILGLILGLVSQSRLRSDDPAHFSEILGDRVHAMARAHDQITADNWGPGALATLINTEAAAYLGARADRIRVSGAPVALAPRAFSTVALVIHELMTNSAKYGALSGESGNVEINWSLDPTHGLAIAWNERDGPPVKPPTRRGFGSMIVERSIVHELNGESSIAYDANGVRARLRVPSEFVVVLDFADTEPKKAPDTVGRRGFTGSVLLVEDNMIIALDAESMLLDLGAARVDVASSVRDALRLIDQDRPAFAFLDVNLGIENSFPIADRLRQLGVPHMFATGYGEDMAFPASHKKTTILKKPYTAASVAAAIAATLAKASVTA